MIDEGDMAVAVELGWTCDIAVTGDTGGISATVKERVGGGIAATADGSGCGISATVDEEKAATRHWTPPSRKMSSNSASE